MSRSPPASQLPLTPRRRGRYNFTHDSRAPRAAVSGRVHPRYPAGRVPGSIRHRRILDSAHTFVAIGGPGTLSVPGPLLFLEVALSGATGAVSVRRSSVFFVQAAEWLEATWLSTAIRESIWAYPIVESIHVLTIAVFLGLTAAMDARLLGAAMRETPVGVVMARLLPWIRSGFAVMVVTGLLLFAGTPVRFVTNVFFQIKLALLVLAGLNVWLFHHRLYPT